MQNGRHRILGEEIVLTFSIGRVSWKIHSCLKWLPCETEPDDGSSSGRSPQVNFSLFMLVLRSVRCHALDSQQAFCRSTSMFQKLRGLPQCGAGSGRAFTSKMKDGTCKKYDLVPSCRSNVNVGVEAVLKEKVSCIAKLVCENVSLFTSILYSM